jgi:carbon storage regulator
MLVLTRRVGEEIIIDGHIRISIAAIQGEAVRLGIQAPPEIRVDRLEVHQRRQAAQSAPDGRLEHRPGTGAALEPGCRCGAAALDRRLAAAAD